MTPLPRPGRRVPSEDPALWGSRLTSRPRRPGRGPCLCRARAPRPGAGLPVPALRAPDGLAVDRDHQPSADLEGPGVCSQAPSTRSSLSGSIMAKARRNVDSSAGPRAAPSPASTSVPASAAHCPIAANDLIPRSPPRSRRREARLANAGGLGSSEGPESGRGDREGTGCGQPEWTKMSSGGGRPSWKTTVSVGTCIVPPGPRPPPADTLGSSPVVRTPQVKALHHDFAVSLGTWSRRRKCVGGRESPRGRYAA
jgi:hypothetical protein